MRRILLIIALAAVLTMMIIIWWTEPPVITPTPGTSTSGTGTVSAPPVSPPNALAEAIILTNQIAAEGSNPTGAQCEQLRDLARRVRSEPQLDSGAVHRMIDLIKALCTN